MFKRQRRTPALASSEPDRAQLQAAEAGWPVGGMSDEQEVVAITRAEAGAVAFEYQPVIGLDAPGVILYREARIRLTSGRSLLPSHFTQS
jgi:hypothetical protein